MKIAYRIQSLVFGAVVAAGLLGGGGWLALQQFSQIQDRGASVALHAQDAIDASYLGARLYRIIADAEINQNLTETATQWSDAKKAESELLTRINGWLDVDADKQVAASGQAAINDLHDYFEHKMMPALKAAGSLTPEIRKMDDDVDGIVQRATEAFGKLRDNLVAKSAAQDRAFDEAISSTISYGGILTISLLVLLAAFGFVVGRSISAPITALKGAMHAIAKGDLAIDIPGRQRHDEVGDMAKVLESLRQNLQSAEAMRIDQQETEMRERDNLARRTRIADEFAKAMENISQLIANSSGEVADAASNLTATAMRTSEQVRVVTGASEETSQNVSTAAAGAEELAASIREINSQVSRSAQIAADAADDAAQTVSNVKALTDSAARIGDVVNLIKDIAEQTNLLALNATIEAARAGESGRGFAVVASEVKQLAGQTAKATAEISAKIDEIQAATSQTVSSIGRIVSTIDTIREVTASIAGAVEEQGAATGEIAQNTQQAASGVQAVAGTIAGVSRTSEETGVAANQLKGLSSNLQMRSSDMQSKVVEFIRSIGAA